MHTGILLSFFILRFAGSVRPLKRTKTPALFSVSPLLMAHKFGKQSSGVMAVTQKRKWRVLSGLAAGIRDPRLLLIVLRVPLLSLGRIVGLPPVMSRKTCAFHLSVISLSHSVSGPCMVYVCPLAESGNVLLCDLFLSKCFDWATYWPRRGCGERPR